MGFCICSGYLMSPPSHGQDFTKVNTYSCLASQIPGECNDKRFYQVSVLSITVGPYLIDLPSWKKLSTFINPPWTFRENWVLGKVVGLIRNMVGLISSHPGWIDAPIIRPLLSAVPFESGPELLPAQAQGPSRSGPLGFI
jgi:hypothetical protein